MKNLYVGNEGRKIYEEFVNKTDRSGKFNKKLIYSKIVGEYIENHDFVLDYGCGKIPNKIKNVPYDVRYIRINHDIGNNVYLEPFELAGLNKAIDIIILSNVLNVQPSVEHIIEVLSDIKFMLQGKGKCIANYPVSPRHSNLSVKELFSIIEKVGKLKITVIHNKTKTLFCKSSAPVFLLENK